MSFPGAPQTSARSTIPTRLLEAWQPDIDDRRNDKPGIISGRNFRDCIDGPCSAWASNFVNFNDFDTSTRTKITELRITNGFLYGTPTGVYKVNPTSLLLEPLLTAPFIAITNPYWPWTISLVGGYYYIAQYGIGLWQYDDVAETLVQIVTPLGNDIRFCVEDHGRLIIMSGDTVANSSLDNGTDFVPSLSTGASAQSLAIIGGTPYRIETVTDGFLVFLSKGMIKGNWSTAAYVYTYTKHSRSVELFSPNASVNIPGLGVVALDGNGFWLTKEYNYETYGYPQPWDVEKSDYIKANILNGMDKNLQGTIMMYYSKALQVLFVAFSSNLLQGFFQTTFCWDLVSKRWSSLDIPHYGIFETYDAVNNQYICSYMDAFGRMHAFQDQNFSEGVPDDGSEFEDCVYRPTATDDIVRVMVDVDLNGGLPFERLNTEILFSAENPFWYRNYTASGLYAINSEPFSDTLPADPDPDAIVGGATEYLFTNFDFYSSGVIEMYAIPREIPALALDSNITVGFWRFIAPDVQAEQFSSVETLLLGINNVIGFEIFEDWNELPGSEDWNALSGDEDWSVGSAFPNIFEAQLTSSNDGYSTPVQGVEDLEIFGDMSAIKLYKPMGWNALYHSLKISANEPYDCFSLKLIDFTANLTGIYQSDMGGG